ncbi:MAG: Crp/Fnr family transcriptional regulator [Chloroflexota bacterium]
MSAVLFQQENTSVQTDTSVMDTLISLQKEDSRFSHNVHTNMFKNNSVVASQEDIKRNIYILLEGKVNLVCPNPNGRRIVVSTLQPGAIFGDGALNQPFGSKVFAEARDDVKLWKIPEDNARTMATQYPILSWGLLQTYGERLLQVEDGMEDVAYKTLPERLANLLLDLNDGKEGELKGISHQNLADHLGTYRETVSAILRDFKSQGLVQLGYRRITILDTETLEDLAGIWEW